MICLVRVVGVDPGTKSFDVCGLEDLKVFYEKSIPSEVIANRPDTLLDVLREAEPLDLVAGPSGYGLPLVSLEDITEEHISLMVLVRKEDVKIPVLVGLAEAVRRLKSYAAKIYFLPGVIHLPTVPEHRKLNAVDMGTADKLCCAALAIHDYASRYKVPYEECTFILVEVGFGYNAIMAIESGRVVDGIGGTKAGPGFLTSGAWDGEVAYLAGSISKADLFSGGVRSFVGDDSMMPEDFPDRAKRDRRAALAWEAFMEGIEKCVWSLRAVVRSPQAIMLSGRLSRVQGIYEELERRLSAIAPVDRVQGFAKSVKEAAQGAALIADGLAGGRMSELVEHMGIRRSYGTVLDYIYIGKVKEKYLGKV
ncbi:MAG: hypothetical protein B9J98_01675 [Candidatus Terraquivivens tikiterensis]|uniref:DUF1464 domain-containing protein n=1 Tax=Candidatus Terraquivivens tikiterensis TaxID=1980982 RepID=A0A2R7Y9P7_9ARCH|nr:MAG: hypothetical protein B9J98_01675 [Candidatus Terraquivivens tikiterensis]